MKQYFQDLCLLLSVWCLVVAVDCMRRLNCWVLQQFADPAVFNECVLPVCCEWAKHSTIFKWYIVILNIVNVKYYEWWNAWPGRKPMCSLLIYKWSSTYMIDWTILILVLIVLVELFKLQISRIVRQGRCVGAALWVISGRGFEDFFTKRWGGSFERNEIEYCEEYRVFDLKFWEKWDRVLRGV